MLGHLWTQMHALIKLKVVSLAGKEANPREPLWAEVQTFTFYLFPQRSSFSCPSLSLWLLPRRTCGSGGSCYSDGSDGGPGGSCTPCVDHPAALPVHLPCPTPAFWLQLKRPVLHWLSLSSNLSQMFSNWRSSHLPLYYWGCCMQILKRQKQELFFLKPRWDNLQTEECKISPDIFVRF